MTSLPTSSVPVKPGSLTVAGSGIASVAHMTLQAVTALKNAARVYYWVNDPVAEAYILDNNANTVNLAIYVEFGKQMHRTYIEMAEVMLREVRAGHDVLGMFYGHPGFFLAPSHRALTIARQEGYEAKMLPGVSTFDYMLAELEFEPAYYGCTVHDAANILVRGKRLDPSQHHVLINISVHAIPTTESESPNFQRLIDHLIQNLGPEHKAVLYTAGILPQTPSAMQVYALEDFHNPLLASAVHGRSCMYIPPRDIAPLNATSLAALGLQDSDLPLFDSTPHWVGPRFVEAAGYGMAEQVIVAELDQHVIPASHRSLRASPAMKQFMIDLALDPKKLKAYESNMAAVIAEVEGLTTSERAALTLATEGPISAVMLRDSEEEPTPAALELLIEWIWDWLFPVAPVPG